MLAKFLVTMLSSFAVKNVIIKAMVQEDDVKHEYDVMSSNWLGSLANWYNNCR